MKKLYLFIILSLFFCIQLTTAATTEGKAFWVSYFGFAPKESIPTVYPEFETYILVASKNNCSGTIVNPNTGNSWPFTVTAGVVEKVVIPFDECYNTSKGDSAFVANTGVFITTTDTASVVAGSFMNGSSDATGVLPLTTLGNSYLISTIPGSLSTSFLVVATEDNTQININLNDTIHDENTAQVMYLPHVDYQITLNKGQVFFAMGDSLTGSSIHSVNCKPIAVFAGDYGNMISDPCYATDLFFEQMYPINTWGKQFLVNPSFDTRPSDSKVVIVSKADNTAVTVKKDGLNTVYTLNKGEYEEIDVTNDGLYIESDNAVAVTQYITDASCAGYGSPYMLWINPIEQQLTKTTFVTSPSANIIINQLEVFALTAKKDQTFLDGSSIGSNFVVCPQNTLYSVARFPILSNKVYSLTNPFGFNAYVYGLTFGGVEESYGYSVGGTMYNREESYQVVSYNGLSSKNYFETNATDNIYNPWDTITINRDIQSVYDSVSWSINGTALVLPEENYQAQLTLKVPACRLKDGLNQLAMIIHKSCNDTIFSNLWLRKPSFDLLSTNSTICQGDSIQLVATTSIPSPKYNWYTQTETLSTQASNPFVLPSVTSKYFVNASFGTYTTPTDSVEIVVKQRSFHVLNEAICPTETYFFDGKVISAPGVYRDTMLNSVGCDSVLTLNLSFYPQQTVYISDSINEGESYTFNGQKLTAEGTYRALLSNSYNCDSTVYLELKVIKHIQPPTVFSPNGDGVNDRFVIKNIEKFPLNTLQIFNRWGNKVFEASPYRNTWDGFNQSGISVGGESLPEGTYFYIIDLGDGSEVKKGYIYLNR